MGFLDSSEKKMAYSKSQIGFQQRGVFQISQMERTAQLQHSPRGIRDLIPKSLLQSQ